MFYYCFNPQYTYNTCHRTNLKKEGPYQFLQLLRLRVFVFSVCVQWKPNNHDIDSKKSNLQRACARLLFCSTGARQFGWEEGAQHHLPFLFLLRRSRERLHRSSSERITFNNDGDDDDVYCFFIFSLFSLQFEIVCARINLLKNYQVSSVSLSFTLTPKWCPPILVWFFVLFCLICVFVFVETDSTPLDREKVPIRGVGSAGHAFPFSTSLRRFAPASF